MYERYYVVNETNETVGDAWFDKKENCYITYIPHLNIYDNFNSFEEMEEFLNKFNLDVV